MPQEAQKAHQTQVCEPNASQSQDFAQQDADAARLAGSSCEHSGAPTSTAEASSKLQLAGQLEEEVPGEGSKGNVQNGSLGQQEAVGTEPMQQSERSTRESTNAKQPGRNVRTEPMQQNMPSTGESTNAEQPGETSSEQQAYQVIFNGRPSRYLENFYALRDEVATILGSRRDMDNFTFTDKGQEVRPGDYPLVVNLPLVKGARCICGLF